MDRGRRPSSRRDLGLEVGCVGGLQVGRVLTARVVCAAGVTQQVNCSLHPGGIVLTREPEVDRLTDDGGDAPAGSFGFTGQSGIPLGIEQELQAAFHHRHAHTLACVCLPSPGPPRGGEYPPFSDGRREMSTPQRCAHRSRSRAISARWWIASRWMCRTSEIIGDSCHGPSAGPTGCQRVSSVSPFTPAVQFRYASSS